ncbi:MAG: TonB-dependent receptor [Gammaproteobacteria bacterium]|nr:TonB-dependent receptor [Gammaproteobacteria bacterium]
MYKKIIVVGLLGMVFLFYAGAAEPGPSVDASSMKPLNQALLELSAKSEKAIIFSTDIVNPGMLVDAGIDVTSIEEALNTWLTPYDLTFVELHDVFVVQDAAMTGLHSGLLLGRVRLAENLAPVSGIRVKIVNTDIVTRTSPDGYFLFRAVPEGDYEIDVVSLGYEAIRPYAINVNEDENLFIYIDIQEKDWEFDRVIVRASQYVLENSYVASEFGLDRRNIHSTPKLAGEALRSLSNIPGFRQPSLSTRGNVRGGATNETLLLFDGIRLYEPYHLRDFLAPFSIINDQRLELITVHTGIFSSRFGDGMSGVVDMTPASPTVNLAGSTDVNLFSTSAHAGGAFGKFPAGWVASISRGNVDLLVDKALPDIGEPSYWDGYFHSEFTTASGVSLSASALFGQDEVRLNNNNDTQNARSDYTDRYYWARADIPLPNGSELKTTASYTSLRSFRTGELQVPGETIAVASDDRNANIVRADVNYLSAPFGPFEVEAGIGYESRRANYDYFGVRAADGPLGAIIGGAPEFQRDLQAEFDETGFYAFSDFRLKAGEKMFIDGGVRFDKRSRANDDNLLASPRIRFAWHMNSSAILTFGAGRYWQSQAITELPIEDGITEFFKPQRTDIQVLGFDYVFSPQLSLRAEAYNKFVRDPWIRFENVIDERSLVPELEADRLVITPESASARGIETTLVYRNENKNRQAWITITYSKAEDRIGSRDIPRRWDQPWQFDLGYRDKIFSWEIQAIARYSSGVPTTPLLLQPGGTVAFGGLSSDRLDNRISLDVRASRTWIRGDNQFEFYVDISNVLDSKIACCVDYSLDTSGTSAELQRSDEGLYPAVPNVGFRWIF